MKQLKEQAPNAVCEVVPWNIPRQLLVNRDKPPFDNPELRRAMALALDRKAFIDIISDGEGSIGGAMMPPPAGSWGMPPEMLAQLPATGPMSQKNRAEAREIMKKLGYGPDKRLAIDGHDPQRAGLSRPGGAADRSAEGDLYRRDAERDRHRAMVSRPSCARTTRSG